MVMVMVMVVILPELGHLLTVLAEYQTDTVMQCEVGSVPRQCLNPDRLLYYGHKTRTHQAQAFDK